MTATVRLSILKKTLDSFFKYMFNRYVNEGHELNLIMNVDPVGNDSSGPGFHSVLKDRFHSLLIKVPEEPSFPKAFKYTWETVSRDADYVFHLEDDWELLRDVNIFHLLRILEGEEKLAILRLPFFHAGPTFMKNWNKFFPYNGVYYECPEDLRTVVGFCGHPSLIKGDFVRNTATYLDDFRNPEKQFHKGNEDVVREVAKWNYGVWGVPGEPPLIQDTGREWMVENGFRKQGSKAYFIQWEKQPEKEGK